MFLIIFLTSWGFRDWPYDPPKKEMRNKRKGHKCDRVAAEKCDSISLYLSLLV